LLVAFLIKKRNRTSNNSIPPTTLSDPGNFLEDVVVGELLGAGNFGEVYKGLWLHSTTIALKKPKTEKYFEDAMKEATVLRSLNHPNIVRYLGLFIDPKNSKYIAMEYVSRGALNILLKEEEQKLTQDQLCEMVKNVASGMYYLQQQNIVHRDLACRNLLVEQGTNMSYQVKVGDFGLSRQLDEAKNYYRTNDETKPVRWSSPEVLQTGLYSTKSDVWSFGIVIWEMFTFGSLPYGGMSNIDVISFVLKGERLELPDNCPTTLQEITKSCWQHQSEKRPDFKEICEKERSFGKVENKAIQRGMPFQAASHNLIYSYQTKNYFPKN